MKQEPWKNSFSPEFIELQKRQSRESRKLLDQFVTEYGVVPGMDEMTEDQERAWRDLTAESDHRHEAERATLRERG